MPKIGEHWEQFKIVAPLGQGGMGEVFLADDTSLHRKVALKFLPGPLEEDAAARERFLREARSAAALDHPYICKIYEIGDVNDKAFIAMEYVEGKSLIQKLEAGPLPLGELLAVASEVVEAVEAAHQKGIVHRDLKAANIMVTPGGHAKVMDFGLATKLIVDPAEGSDVDTLSARLTAHGATPGTVVYMSPEQVRGEQLDARSDIFSIGVLLYELATANVPFQGATSGLTYDAILNRGAIPPTQLNPSVPTELEQIIQKALEKDRDVRYQSARDLLVDLRRLRRDSDVDNPAFTATAAAAAPIASAASTSTATAASKPSFAGVGLVAIALLLLAVAWMFLRSSPESAPAGDAIQSLAVLPFENSRDDPEVDYLSDGIAESLINRLSQLPQLSVQARSTAFRFRGQDLAPQAIGKQLGVGAVLTGRVMQQGTRLNVQAELVDTAKGTQIWGQQYEQELDDLLTVQNDLAAEISRALRLELTGAEFDQIAAGGTTDNEAYQAYLRGRHLWLQRTNERFKEAIAYFEEALEKDPDYALAYAGLADSYFLLGAQFYGADPDYPPADAIAQARAAALQAVRLDPSLAEPRATLGFIRFTQDWNWEMAEEDFLAAIERKPNYPTARQWYALLLMALDRHDEALEQAGRAVAIDPTGPLSSRMLGIVSLGAGRLGDGISQLERTLELSPAFPLAREYLMTAYWAAGDTERAIVIADQYDAAVGEFFRAASGQDAEEARQKLFDLPEELRSGNSVSILLVSGETDRYLEELTEMFANRDAQLPTAFASPLIGELRDDPRMKTLRENMGLPND